MTLRGVQAGDARGGRRMSGSWISGKPYCRWKFPAECAVSEKPHAKTTAD